MPTTPSPADQSAPVATELCLLATQAGIAAEDVKAYMLYVNKVRAERKVA